MAQKKAVLAKLKNLAKNNGHIFVIASEEPKLEKAEMTAYKCTGKECGTKFHALAGMQPYCITCGSDEVDEDSDESSFELPADDSEMSAIQCSACGTHNILDDEVAQAYSGNINCVTCGSEVQYQVAAPADASGDAAQKPFDNSLGDEEPKTGADSNVGTETVKGPDDNAGENSVMETKEVTSAEGDKSATDEKSDAGEKSDVEDDVSGGSDGGKEKSEDSEKSETTESSGETASVKLITVAKTGELSFELSGDKLTAYVGTTPVATLEKAKAGENAGVIHSNSFAQAIKHTAKQQGVERALAHFNFDLISVDLPIPAFVQEKAEAQIKGEREKFETATKSLRSDYRNSLQIVSAGLNKSFFKGKGNVLKAALFDELAATGVRNPAKIIDKVFAAHSDAYHTLLLEMAEDMMGKNAEARKQIAEAIGVANYQVAEMDEESEDSEESSENDGGSVEEKLESAGLRKTKHFNSPSSVVASTIKEIREGNGGRLFKR